MRQLQAGIKKELLELAKTYRLMGFLLTFLGLAVLDPLVIKGMAVLLDIFKSSPSFSMMQGMPELFNQSMGLSSFVGDVSNTGVLITFLLLMRTAGGEQKKRNCIIPITLGFDRECYIYSKFLVYPPVVFVLGFVGYLTAYGVSSLLFLHNITFVQTLLPALALALYLAFQVCLLLALGCATGKSGIWVAVLYGFNTLMTLAVNTLGWNSYNPFALTKFAMTFSDINPADYAVSAGIAVTLCFVGALCAATVFKHKKLV